MIKPSLAVFLVLFSNIALAFNYCDVPSDYLTHGLNYKEVVELFHNAPANAIWECGLLKNIYKLSDGHTTELHYKNAVILLDGDDFGFVSQGQVDGLTVYGKTDKYNVNHFVALQGLQPRMRLFIKEAIAVTVVKFSSVRLPNGDIAYIPILARAY